MPKPLTIDFDTFKEMFQLENPDFHLDADLGRDTEEIYFYHTILNGIQSPLAPYFDATQSPVKNFKVYAGESAQLQSSAFIDFEVPSTNENGSPDRYLAMLLYYLEPHPQNSDKLGITVSFFMHGKLEACAEKKGEIKFVPAEAKYRKIEGKNTYLIATDVNFPNNVKSAFCYADAIFRCFLDGTVIDYSEIQDWMNMDAYVEVADRYAALLQRNAEDLVHEITNDEDLDLRGLEGRVVFNEPSLKQ